MKKYFDVIGVAEICTGYCLGDNGLSRVQEIMNHLYPGIMTLGICEMKDTATEELYRQHPKLHTFILSCNLNMPPVGPERNEYISSYIQLLKFSVGHTLSIEGPHNLNWGEHEQA